MNKFLFGKLTIIGGFVALSGAFIIPCPVYESTGLSISIIGLVIMILGTYRRTRRLKRQSIGGS